MSETRHSSHARKITLAAVSVIGAATVTAITVLGVNLHNDEQARLKAEAAQTASYEAEARVESARLWDRQLGRKKYELHVAAEPAKKTLAESRALIARAVTAKVDHTTLSDVTTRLADVLGAVGVGTSVTDLEVVAAAVSEAAPAVETAVVEWEKAEAARKAAEEAARQAAASRQGWTPQSGESLPDRVARVAATLPFHVPYIYRAGGCSISAYACYEVGGSIYVGAAAAQQSDCRIRYTLAHEYKHLLQHQAGQIQYDGSGQITNRDWLEYDAQVFGHKYGCGGRAA